MFPRCREKLTGAPSRTATTTDPGQLRRHSVSTFLSSLINDQRVYLSVGAPLCVRLLITVCLSVLTIPSVRRMRNYIVISLANFISSMENAVDHGASLVGPH
jgi:hypothetical protein